MNTEIEQRVVDEIFSASEAWDNMQVLADDIGSRLAGSHGEVAARDFLVEMLNRYGVDRVDVEPFPHLGWECKGEALSVVEPVQREIACRCAGLSPPADGLEAELVFLKKCDEEEVEARREEIRGKMVVAPYHPVPRQVKMPIAAGAGAVALLESRSVAGGLQPARTCAFNRIGDIPTASISREDGAYLQRLAQRKGSVRLRLSLDSAVAWRTSWNVVGLINGREEEREYVALGGHYDSWHVGSGAVDNGTGVVAVLEAARGIAQYKTHMRRGVRFIFFGVEELGLVGSWAYVHQHMSELDRAVLMINNDVGGRPVRLISAGFEGVRSLLNGVAERARVAEVKSPLAVEVGNPGWASDHFPFWAHGVPTVAIGCEQVNPDAGRYVHTRADTADKVYAAGLTECAAINAQLVCAVANAAGRPEPRKHREEIEVLLDKFAWRQTLDRLEAWPPEALLDRYFTHAPAGR
ncbi:MAG: M28 family metallopeptidase [Candidatus Latescibacterota bacterium]